MVHGTGFMDHGLCALSIQDLRFEGAHTPTTDMALNAPPADMAHARTYVWGLGFGVSGLGCRVWGLGFGVLGAGFGVWDAGFGVWGAGFGIWGLGSGVWGLVFGV